MKAIHRVLLRKVRFMDHQRQPNLEVYKKRRSLISTPTEFQRDPRWFVIHKHSNVWDIEYCNRVT